MKFIKEFFEKNEKEISFDVGKLQIFGMVLVLVLFSSIFYVNAQRAPTHFASEIIVTVNNEEVTFQEAVNSKTLGTFGSDGTDGEARHQACRICLSTANGWQGTNACDSTAGDLDDWTKWRGSILMFAKIPTGFTVYGSDYPSWCPPGYVCQEYSQGGSFWATTGQWCYQYWNGGNSGNLCTDEDCYDCAHGCCYDADPDGPGGMNKHCYNPSYWDGDGWPSTPWGSPTPEGQGYEFHFYNDGDQWPGSGNPLAWDYPYMANLCCKSSWGV